ncbi:MAG: nucleotidyltransferase family protein [Thermodesulfobacteriota bacterium]
MMMIKEAVILAGGFGTRLKSVVSDLPKPMADTGGRPFLSCLIDYLAIGGVRRVILSVGYMHETITDYFKTEWNGVEIRYVVEHKPLGTGGALKAALGAVSGSDVLVLNGDSFLRIDLADFSRFHLEKNGGMTMAVKRMKDLDRYGTVILDGETVRDFIEKMRAGAGYINAGVYILNKKRCGLLETDRESFSFEKDFLHKRTGSGSVFAYICNEYFIDIGLPEDYMKAKKDFGNLRKGGGI